jgi:putative Holliday junction resolvase
MGRVLGLDFGIKRVGAALSDPRRQLATPREVYARRSEELDARHYADLVRADQVDQIVIGLPLHTGGSESELSLMARRWGAWLANATGRRVTFFDERYSTVEAEAILRAHGFSLKERKARRDMLSAQILLQAYLDAGCPATEAPAEPLADTAEN